MLNDEDPYVVDIDIGGTYTDAIFSNRKGSACFKTDTTPSDLSQCFRDALQKGAGHFGFAGTKPLLAKVQVIRLSTSLSTNTLLQRKGDRVGLLVSKGHGRKYPRGFKSVPHKRHILLPDRIFELNEPLAHKDIREKAYTLLTRGVSTLVVCLDDASGFQQREVSVKKIVRQYFPKHSIGSVPVLLSSQLSRDPDYYKRINTALLNAYVHSALSRQILTIEDFLKRQDFAYPLLIVHSNGGSARAAKSAAIRTLSSGAAAGIYGARHLASSYGKTKVVVVDVGGTSTEIGWNRNSQIKAFTPSMVEGLPLDIVTPVNATLNMGGGSIARIGKGGDVCFDGDSVGAFPGPACYGLGGTEATLTDVYLILGYFDENFFLGGQRRVHMDAARKIVDKKIAQPLKLSVEEAALRIKKEAAQTIGKSIKALMLAEREHVDAFSLFAVGGGGGCIASDLMDEVGFREAHIFRLGSVFGAYGSSSMDILHQYKERLNLVWKRNHTDSATTARALNKSVLELQSRAGKDMAGEGFSPEKIRFEVELELRLPSGGAVYRLALPTPFLWPETAFTPFPREIKSPRNLLITGLILKALGMVPHAQRVPRKYEGDNESFEKGSRRVYESSKTFRNVRVYDWDTLFLPCEIPGPAILESRETTAWLPEGKTLTMDEYANGTIKRVEVPMN